MKQKRSPALQGLALLLSLSLLTGCSTRGNAFFGTRSSAPSADAASSASNSSASNSSANSGTSGSDANGSSTSGSTSSAANSSASAPQAGDWQLTLVNAANPIPEDWSVALSMTQYDYEVDTRIIPELDAMIAAAKQEGVTLLPCYGYRTLEQAAELFQKQINRQMASGLPYEEAVTEAKRWVAPPGTSDHHTGLALDIVTPEHQVLNHAFAQTPAAQWMAKHSTEYGFVIRFPEDKQEITGITYEPWHLRYVGVSHATAMQEQNLCLEEYVAQIGDTL